MYERARFERYRIDDQNKLPIIPHKEPEIMPSALTYSDDEQEANHNKEDVQNKG